MAGIIRGLFENEDITSAEARGPSGPTTDESINERYSSGEVRIVTEQARYSLKQIPDLVESADYNLQPAFQRRPRWPALKQSRLIESFIMNVPVPPIFLYESEFSRYEVMDGRQRLTAISDFYNDRFALEGLEFWPELNNRKYSDLPEQVRRGIDRRYLSSIILLHETAKTEDEANALKQLVFRRINTGGEDLSDQETRNALHPGPMNDLCIRLARHPPFCRMWEIPEPEANEDVGDPTWSPPVALASDRLFKTMGDAELVLRFFAHRQRSTLWRSGTRLDDFLTRYLIGANRFHQELLTNLESLFKETCDSVNQVLGDEAFWARRFRSGTWMWIARPTLVTYDPIMNAFSELIDYREELASNSTAVNEGLVSLYEQNSSAFDGRKVNLADVQERDRLMFDFLASCI